MSPEENYVTISNGRLVLHTYIIAVIAVEELNVIHGRVKALTVVDC